MAEIDLNVNDVEGWESKIDAGGYWCSQWVNEREREEIVISFDDFRQHELSYFPSIINIYIYMYK